MSGREHFIARWSRRKRAAIEGNVADASNNVASEVSNAVNSEEHSQPPDRPADERLSSAHSPVADGPLADLSRLPPIESITAETDVRGFLAPGVPLELSRAALRRAWTSDPAIRDFVGLADYDWDFNTPGAIQGFGPLEMTDELRRQVAQILGHSFSSEQGLSVQGPSSGEEERAAAAASRTGSTEESAASGNTTDDVLEPPQVSNIAPAQVEPITNDNARHNQNVGVQFTQVYVASQHRFPEPDNVAVGARRPHGRALPK
jgi:hypothetical protein